MVLKISLLYKLFKDIANKYDYVSHYKVLEVQSNTTPFIL